MSVLVPQTDRIKGSSPGHAYFFLRFFKMFLRISIDAIYNRNRLDSQSDYSFIPTD